MGLLNIIRVEDKVLGELSAIYKEQVKLELKTSRQAKELAELRELMHEINSKPLAWEKEI